MNDRAEHKNGRERSEMCQEIAGKQNVTSMSKCRVVHELSIENSATLIMKCREKIARNSTKTSTKESQNVQVT